jgi:cyclin-C
VNIDVLSSDTSKLGECEFALISEMNSQLIVHHPYRSLTEIQNTINLSQEETMLAWSIINDHYLTDLPLLHPPHVIALSAAILAVVLKPTQGAVQFSASSLQSAVHSLGSGQAAAAAGGANQLKLQRLVAWLAESNVDIEAVADCTQELISLYDLWEHFNEKACKEQLQKFVKARGLDK